MGIYGQGNAFNRRYLQQHTYTPYGHTNYTPSKTYIIQQQQPGFQFPFMQPHCHGPKTNWWALSWGALTGFGGAWAGNSVSGQNTSASAIQANPANQVDELKNLQTLFPKHKIIQQADGKFMATDANGKCYGPADFNEMCKLLSSTDSDAATAEPATTPATTPETTPATTPETPPATTPEQEGQGDADYAANHNGYSPVTKDDTISGNMIVHDHVLGTKADINGTTKVSEEKTADGFPKTITVKGYTYDYKETKDGVAIYKSHNGKGDEYRLEKKGTQFALNQYDGDSGAGSFDITTKINR
ncbi:MAG: hypothetical protein ACI37Q_05600 [Candidatus Gastranaerophilaceae bacterium]